MTGLSARGIRKTFDGVDVLHGVDFDVLPGEVHALVGENGAGKSTLIKILGGAVTPDGGDVRLDGRPLPPGDPLGTRGRGISVVYQEFTLVPGLSVADNIFLGRERGRWRLHRAESRRAAADVLRSLGVSLDPDVRVADLSIAHQQMVEIARALALDARVLILDEPTSSLSDTDAGRLFQTLRRLRAAGLAIVYISHRLGEVFALADRITVLRDGRAVGTSAPSAVDRAAVIRWMVGRDLAEEFPARTASRGEMILEVRHLASPGRLADATFDVRAGEVVALAGLVGSGRTSAGLALAGAIPSTGEVRLNGSRVRFRSPAGALAGGLAYVTEDRKGYGLFPDMNVGENVTLTSLRKYARGGLLSIGRERAAAERAGTEFDIRSRGLRQRASTLSGGNQQKVLVARFLLEPRSVVVLDEPTRGVDVGARAEIYGLINRLASRGLGVLMISSDLPEVLGMADRIAVMRDGRTVGEISGGATAERVMALATGSA